jgi:hypothetical protein
LESDPWEVLVESLKRCGRTEQEIDAVLEELQKQEEIPQEQLHPSFPSSLATINSISLFA